MYSRPSGTKGPEVEPCSPRSIGSGWPARAARMRSTSLPIVADDQLAGIDPDELGVHGCLDGALPGNDVGRRVGLVIVAGGYLGGGHYRFSLVVAAPQAWPTPARKRMSTRRCGWSWLLLSVCGTHSPKRRRPRRGGGAGLTQPAWTSQDVPTSRGCSGPVHRRWPGCRAIARREDGARVRGPITGSQDPPGR